MRKLFAGLLMLTVLLSFCACAEETTHATETLNPETTLSAEDVYTLLTPSTVEIIAHGHNFESTGTGFFIDESGTLVTNYHVIENCTEAYVSIYDGGKYDVLGVVGYDVELDLAILSTSHKNSKAVAFRESEVRTGETVYALGSSLGLTGTFSEGIISTAQRNLGGITFIQTTAPISSGNSGGPLVDSVGNVVGITSAGFADGQNLNLAIPISNIKNIKNNTPMTLREVRKAESKGVLAESKGVLIVAVEPSFYPYSAEENGKFFGLHIDIAEEFALRNGYVAEFVAADWSDLFTGISDGSFNLVFGIAPTPERQDAYKNTSVHFTDVYYDGMAAMFNVNKLDLSFGEWSQFKYTIRNMIEDGTIASMLASYNLK